MIIIIFTHCTFWPLFLWKKNDNRSNGAFSAKLKTSYKKNKQTKKKNKWTGVWIKPDTRFINEKMARYRHVLIGFKSFKRCTLTSLYIEVEFWSGESWGAAHWRCCIPKYVCWIQLYSQGRRVMTAGHVWIFLQQCLRGTLAHFIVCWNWKTLPLSSHLLMKCELIRQRRFLISLCLK